MLLNLGFGLTVIVALLLLVVAWGVTWYSDHLASAATVNGTTITKDAWNKQMAVNAYRADYEQRQIRTLLAAGRINSTDADARMSILQQRAQQTDSISLEQLIDGTIQDQLAQQQGITVSDADIDARVAQDGTTPELRHAWMIEVTPLKTGESTPTDAEKAAAKATADQALADLKAGKDWDSIAKAVSTDTTTKNQAGDLSYVDKSATLDPAFRDALMAAQKDTPTDVILGADGIYRIGRVSEIIPPQVDATYATQINDFKSGTLPQVTTADLREATRRDVLHDKLAAAVLAPYLQPGPQRDVSEIYMQEGQSETGPNAIKVRHILYSPNGDPSTATNVKPDDPAWAAAKAKADATYAKLQANPSLFDSIARAESNESAARTSGGKLPYFSTDDAIDPAFAMAIQQPGLQPGQLLPPVKSSFGWHVIQVMHGPTDAQWADKLKSEIDAGTLTFADAARDNSDSYDPATGGSIGWVAKGQLKQQLEDAIFAAPIGKVSDPLKIDGDGTYLFLVNKEENRAPDATQTQTLQNTVFSDWYTTEKAKYSITRDAVPSSDPSTGRLTDPGQPTG
jgi:parvulin-like peptidyl-prolyl isomerase